MPAGGLLDPFCAGEAGMHYYEPWLRPPPSPDQYEIVDVRTHRRGVRRAMLFPKAILQAEFAANATVRQRMAIRRKQLGAKRPAKQTSPS